MKASLRIGWLGRLWIEEPGQRPRTIRSRAATELVATGGIADALVMHRTWPRWFRRLERHGIRVEEVPPGGPVRRVRFRAPPLPEVVL